jgi:hypothetical protein
VPLSRLPAAERRAARRSGAHAVGRIPHHAGLAEALRRQGRFRQRHHPRLLRRLRHAALRAGLDTFDDASWFRLEANIFTKSAQPWDRLDPAVPAFATYPTGKSYSP